MSLKNRLIGLLACFIVASAHFPIAATAQILTPQPGDTDTPSKVVWCLAADAVAKRLYYSPPRSTPAPSAAGLRRLSARFANSVQGRVTSGLSIAGNSCSASPDDRTANGALSRRKVALEKQGYIPVVVGVF